MTSIHFFGGESGGIGKSFMTRTAVQYLMDREQPFTVFDADRTKHDIYDVFEDIGCQRAIFSEDDRYEDDALHIYESALSKPALVNLPANSYVELKGWISNNDVATLSQEDKISLWLWHLSDGSDISVNLFLKVCSEMGNTFQYVLVKNSGKNKGNWDMIDNNEEVQKLIKKYKVTVVDLPRLNGEKCHKVIEGMKLSFGKAKQEGVLDRINRQRIALYLKLSYQNLDSAKIFA